MSHVDDSNRGSQLRQMIPWCVNVCERMMVAVGNTWLCFLFFNSSVRMSIVLKKNLIERKSFVRFQWSKKSKRASTEKKGNVKIIEMLVQQSLSTKCSKRVQWL